MTRLFRWKYFIDKQLQTKFILYSVLLLLIYTLLFAFILFAPYAIPLTFDYSLEEKTTAARMLLSLHKSIWPALGLVILLLSGASIFVSHKVAGPMYRLKRFLLEIAGGNIDLTLKFRKRDDLHDLAANVNLVITELRELVGTLQKEMATVSGRILEVEQLIQQGDIKPTAGRQMIQQLEADQETIARALAKYVAR